MAYKVKFYKRITPTSAGAWHTVYLYREVELSFVPVPGVLFADGDWEAKADLVVYDLSKGIFEIATAPDDTMRDAQIYGNEIPSLEDLVEGYLRMGWLKEEKNK